jgi:hypothetical protein
VTSEGGIATGNRKEEPMAHANAELIRRAYAAFGSGDMETLTELIDENASWHVPGRGPLAGDHEGREAIFAFFGQLGEQTGGTFKVDLRSATADDDGRVVGIHRNGGERNGKRLGVNCCLLFEVKDGRIVDAREHFEDLCAYDDFWS